MTQKNDGITVRFNIIMKFGSLFWAVGGIILLSFFQPLSISGISENDKDRDP